MTESAPFRLPTSVRPERYEITIRPDLDKQVFTGEELIRIEVIEPTSSVTLNSADLAIGSARLTNDDITEADATVTFDADAETATLHFDETLQPGMATVLLTFSGKFNPLLCGIYPSTFTDNEGNERIIQTTHFEATDARRAFPCWDEPEYKAVFGITLIIDESLAAYANSPVLEEKDLGGGVRQVSFADTMKMSTYLVCFVVGPLVESETRTTNGVPMRVVSVPGREHLHEYALNVCEASLAYYANYFELPYPGDKMDMIALPDFAMGAMENLGCVTYRETALLVDPKRASRPEIERVTEVIAHENAHMWFGDLVTMKWWNGIWLNEAFATFMAAMFADDFRPEWDTWTTFALSRNAAMNVDSLTTTRPIEYEVVHPDDARGMFDILTYEKGCAVLRMCEQFIGAEEFRRGIAAYLKRHAYANTETSDLWDALEEASNQPVRAMMDSWIFQGGYPVLDVSLSDDHTLSIAQRRFRYLDDADSSDTPPLWNVPVTVRVSVDGAVQVHKFILDTNSSTLELGGQPDWLVVNDRATGFYRVQYDDSLAAKLRGNLHELSAIERVSLLSDTWANVLAGSGDLTAFLDMVRAIAHDDDPNVWATALGPLYLIEKVIKPVDRSSFQHVVRELCAPKFAALGWNPVEGESEQAKLLRGILVSALGQLGNDRDVIQAAEARYNGFLSDHTSVDPNIVESIEGVLAHTNDVKWYEHFIRRFEDPTNTPQEQMNALDALASFSDDVLVQRLLAYIWEEKVRSQDAPFAIRMLLSRHEDPSDVWTWIEQNWEELNRRYPESAIPRMLGGAISQVDPGFIDRAVAFLESHPVPQAQQTVDQTRERLCINKAFATRNRDLIYKI